MDYESLVGRKIKVLDDVATGLPLGEVFILMTYTKGLYHSYSLVSEDSGIVGYGIDFSWFEDGFIELYNEAPETLSEGV